MPIKALIYLFLFFSSSAVGQTVITWDDLAKVEHNEYWSNDKGTYICCPIFDDSVKKLDGKEVVLKGYINPIDIEGSRYTFTKFQSVFGPCLSVDIETIIEIKPICLPSKYEMSQKITLEGKFKLNWDDCYEVNYIIEDVHEYVN